MKTYKYGKRSQRRLNEVHPDLQLIANELIKMGDYTILCGYRNKADQDKAYNEKRSQLKYPQSKHNQKDENGQVKAMDIAPYPIDWNDIERFEKMCCWIEAIAEDKGINIRLGRDFSFKDYPHIELLDD